MFGGIRAKKKKKNMDAESMHEIWTFLILQLHILY